MKTYSFQQFIQDYPNDDVCLDRIFQNSYGNQKYCPNCGAETKFYRLKNRKAYSCMHCRYQIHPLAGTIFHKSETPLTKWFYAMHLFSVSKNGVSALELQRHLQVTYKCAYRIGRKIRDLMEQNQDILSGIVEIDETYFGGKYPRYKGSHLDNKTAVIGMTERKGQAKAHVAFPDATTAIPLLKTYVEPGSTIHTDESRIYSRVRRHFTHEFVNHSKHEYVKAGVHTNSIESFWGQMKRSIDGTYHCVSPKHLQSYVNQFVFLYNHRGEQIYPVLMARAAKRV